MNTAPRPADRSSAPQTPAPGRAAVSRTYSVRVVDGSGRAVWSRSDLSPNRAIRLARERTWGQPRDLEAHLVAVGGEDGWLVARFRCGLRFTPLVGSSIR